MLIVDGRMLPMVRAFVRLVDVKAKRIVVDVRLDSSTTNPRATRARSARENLDVRRLVVGRVIAAYFLTAAFTADAMSPP